jgi:hypothetical protein
MGQPVVHFEIMGSDGPKLHAFYADLFGWHIEDMGPDMGHYGGVDTHAGEGINGGVGGSQDGSSSVTFYIEVDDPQAVLDQIESLGGKTTAPVTEIPNIVTFAQFADPFGHVVGLVKGGDEGPGVSKGDGIPVAWFELVGSQPKETMAFYENVFGWKGKGGDAEGFVYFEIDATQGGRGTHGGIGGSQDGTAAVTVYAGVDDVQAYLDKAEALGGTKTFGPMDVSPETQIGQFKDPQGNIFGLFRHTHPQ